MNLQKIRNLIFPCIVILSGCGRNLTVVKEKLIHKPKIAISEGMVHKLWISGREDVSGPENYHKSPKRELPSEYNGFIDHLADQIIDEFNEYDVTFVPDSLLPKKKTNFLGNSYSVTDWGKTPYNLIIVIDFQINYHQKSIGLGSPYKYELHGAAQAKFYEKQPDGELKWLMINLNGAYTLGFVQVGDGNEYQYERNLDELMKTLPPHSIVEKLLLESKQGANRLASELEAL